MSFGLSADAELVDGRISRRGKPDVFDEEALECISVELEKACCQMSRLSGGEWGTFEAPDIPYDDKNKFRHRMAVWKRVSSRTLSTGKTVLPPTLVIELKSDASEDVAPHRLQVLFKAGVRHVWRIDCIASSIEVITREGSTFSRHTIGVNDDAAVPPFGLGVTSAKRLIFGAE